MLTGCDEHTLPLLQTTSIEASRSMRTPTI